MSKRKRRPYVQWRIKWKISTKEYMEEKADRTRTRCGSESHRTSSRSRHNGHVWLRSSQVSKHISWNLSIQLEITHPRSDDHVRMFTGRPQDPLIALLELCHANRTLLHRNAQQGQLQLHTSIPRHSPPHKLHLAHEIRPLLFVLNVRQRWLNTGWRRGSRSKEVRDK